MLISMVNARSVGIGVPCFGTRLPNRASRTGQAPSSKHFDEELRPVTHRPLRAKRGEAWFGSYRLSLERIDDLAHAITPSKPPFDLSPPVRLALLIGSTALFGLALFAVGRAALGLAPSTPWIRDAALLLHISTVIPAIPLGLYIFVTRKGNSRHKLLGKVWLTLMGTTAVATFFIRNVGDGGLSWLHIFSALTLIGIPQAIITARRREIAKHKAHLLQLFVGALLIAGGASFLPGRTMWQWAFG